MVQERLKLTHLPNAPLIYTLGVVRFPAVPSMERFFPAFHDTVRASYPHKDNLTLQQMRIDFGTEGAKIEQVPLVLWQFASPDRKLALVLSSETLALHTVSYEDNQTFIEQFRDAISNLIFTPYIGIAWINAISIRYIDLVAPKDGGTLDHMLKPSVLPPPFIDVAGLNLIEGVYVARYMAPTAEVRFQILRNPLTVLPADLNTPLIQFNKWDFKRPSTEFAVVDTDCSVVFATPIAMDVNVVCAHMYELRSVAKSIFLKIGTEYAEKLWKGDA
jgi:uncharacterized protein (TIGR04255 family)